MLRTAIIWMCVVACATPPRPRCTVLVREHWHVVSDGEAVARVAGDCRPDDVKCRNVLDKRAYDRDGHCTDHERAGVDRVWCIEIEEDEDDQSQRSISDAVDIVMMLVSGHTHH